MDRPSRFFMIQIEQTIELVSTLDLNEIKDRISLYNALTSLMLLPIEDVKSRGTRDNPIKLFDIRYSALEDMFDFQVIRFRPINGVKNGSISFSQKTTDSFFKKLRNSIAHQNISFDEDNPTWMGFFNVFPLASNQRITSSLREQCVKENLIENGRSIEDFRIEIELNELRRLAIWIGQRYLAVME